MAARPPATSRESSPPLPRRRLARILGLSPEASRVQIDAALPRLLARLGARLEDSAQTDAGRATELRQEISDLAISRARLESFPDPSAEGTDPHVSPRPPRGSARFGAILGTGITLCLLIAYAAGYRIAGPDADRLAQIPTVPGVLIIEGVHPSATLRIFDADREELLLKTSALGARVEVPPGRVALEVSREDCPDHWTRSVFFEERSTHRFEPRICLGQGEVTIRSNVAGDRLRIDGIDAGATTAEPHLLGVGDHEIRIDKTGYEPFLGIVRIRPDSTLEIRAELIAGGPHEAPRGRPMPVSKQPPENPPSDSPASHPLAPSSQATAGDGRNSASNLVPDLALELSPRWASDLGSEFGLGRDPFVPAADRPDYYVAAAPGSTRWHDRVSADMVSRYDQDASGQIDRLQESEAIPCRVWRDLERDFDAGRLGLSMVRYFGFDGSEWHPNALGFARAHRSAVFEKMKECGLQS